MSLLASLFIALAVGFAAAQAPTPTPTPAPTPPSDLEKLAAGVANIASALDLGWLITMGLLVFLMQAGFAMVEAGAISSKHVVSVLVKNFTDMCFGGIVWYLWGFAFALGKHNQYPNNFIGNGNFALNDVSSTDWTAYATWFFQYTFCATSATIVSGAVAGRVNFKAYLLFTVFMTGWIYPIILHSAWSTEGWLSPTNAGITSKVGIAGRGVYDFAGSGVVHLTGGTAAFVGAWIVGPRTERVDENGKFRVMSGHSMSLSTVGCFMLMTCWYAFNCGSTLGLTNGLGKVAARCAVTRQPSRWSDRRPLPRASSTLVPS